MKVIGKTDDGFIVQMEESEVAEIAGFCGAYDCAFKALKVREGSVVEVSKMYDEARETLEDYESIKGMAEQLQGRTKSMLEKMANLITHRQAKKGKKNG